MFDERFMLVAGKEGVVSIVSCSNNEAHVVNTWNTYLIFPGENRILIPVYGMRKTQQKVEENNTVLLTLGTKEVEGKKRTWHRLPYQGNSKVHESGPRI